jgi:NRPS condensation-like uncharacterized protein
MLKRGSMFVHMFYNKILMLMFLRELYSAMNENWATAQGTGVCSSPPGVVQFLPVSCV